MEPLGIVFSMSTFYLLTLPSGSQSLSTPAWAIYQEELKWSYKLSLKLWGIFNEDKFIALEDEIKTLWRNRNGKH